MLKKPKWIKPSSIKNYDIAIRVLREIEKGKRRAEKMKEVVRMRPFYDMPFDEVISRINQCLLLLQTEKSG